MKRSEQWQKEFESDPVATREKIMTAYLAVSPQNFAETHPPEKAETARESIRQAQRERDELAALAPYVERYGKNFPHILAQLQKFDRDLIADPVGVSARLAANAGAPVTETQQRAYEAKLQAQAHQAKDSANVHRAIEMIIEHNVLPDMGNDATLHAIADVLSDKNFKRTGDRLQDLRNAHANVMARKANSEGNRYDPGSRSIGGAPSTSGDDGRDGRSRTAVGAAVSRAFSKS
jgi:hypothetical protein